jgi:hypothetical protein
LRIALTIAVIHWRATSGRGRPLASSEMN